MCVRMNVQDHALKSGFCFCFALPCWNMALGRQADHLRLSMLLVFLLCLAFVTKAIDFLLVSYRNELQESRNMWTVWWNLAMVAL